MPINNNFNNKLDNKALGTESARATKRGTRIVKKGQDLDKNAFLKILTAQLANQDPFNAKDSTEFISQMAQFSSLEQMANLNGTMTLSSASNLTGKLVSLNAYDNYGKQYGGLVKNVTKNGDEIKLEVEVTNNGKRDIKEFKFSDVQKIFDNADNDVDNIYGNKAFVMASGLIGRHIQAISREQDSEGKLVDKIYKGTVKGVAKDIDGIKVKVATAEGDKYIPYNYIVELEEVSPEKGE